MRWIAVLSLLLLSALAQARFVYRVEIEGLGERGDALRSQLDIEAWHDSEEMNLEQLQRLHSQTPERLQELLATQGYFNARVEPELVQDGEVWVARYVIHSGQQAKVGRLDLRFEGAISGDGVDPGAAARRRKLTSLWPLKAGEAFEQDFWRQGKKLLLETLIAENYPHGRIESSEARVSEDGSTIDLRLVINSGPLVRFGRLRISGLSTYPEKTVSNLNTIIPGSNFEREELLDYQTRLIQSGYFAGVLVDIQGSAQNADENGVETADIVVQVTELKRQQVRLGLGYSTDSRERIQLGYEHRNIFHRAWRWSSLIKADHLTQSLSTEIAFPAGTNLYQDSVGYSLEHNELGLGETYDNRIYAKRQWGDTRFERTLSLELLKESSTKIIPQTDGPNVEVEQDNITTSLGYVWIKRDVDDLVFPTRGQIRDFEGLVGTRIKLNPYLRLYARWNRYQPLGGRWFFQGRVELGQLLGPIENVPVDYLFLAGGDNTIRGFPYQSIGLEPDSPILGARTLAILSTEVQYWLTPKWGIGTFLDTGSLGEQLMRGSWYQGYGAGLRWRSPVGPLNLDYAWGRQAHDYQIHFSVGLAF